LKPEFSIEKVSWQSQASSLKMVRERVFIVEQHVPILLEWDGLDQMSQHLLAVNSMGEAIGCARLLEDGSIGRMAVLKEWRGKGVGSAILKSAIAINQQQDKRNIMLSAQMHAVHFYEKFGFVKCSPPYLDANIWHVDMRLETKIA
jgi:predicted GNAT family N-acyltransferase